MTLTLQQRLENPEICPACGCPMEFDGDPGWWCFDCAEVIPLDRSTDEKGQATDA